MARGYLSADRDQVLLLPPDMREWLPSDHLVWLILDAVAAVDTAAFHAGRRTGGVGRAGWDPDVLLALLLYCYCEGERSSRRIEQRCVTDVACRVITADRVPDHTVIARFREGHDAAFKSLFGQVLALCASAGMARVGTVALDGTKIDASASRMANRSRDQLRDEAVRIVEQARDVDAGEDRLFGDRRGDELAGAAQPSGDRVARLRRCLDELDAHPARQAKIEVAQRRVERGRAAVQRERQRVAAQRDGTGHDGPKASAATIRRAEEQLTRAEAVLDVAQRSQPITERGTAVTRNTTDPDSRTLRSQGAWVQGYNAQAAVSEDGVIVACDVINDASDVLAFEPMLQRVDQTCEAAGLTEGVGTLVADAGYASEHTLTCPGPDRLIALPDPHRSDAAQAMRERLETPQGKAIYRKRLIVEAAFGDIKHNQRFRAFSRRGIDAVQAEWSLVCTARNLRLLQHRGPAVQ